VNESWPAAISNTFGAATEIEEVRAFRAVRALPPVDASKIAACVTVPQLALAC
jgi:hypothetical protein